MFHEVRIPDRYSYKSRGGPAAKVLVSESDSGHQNRVALWDGVKYRFEMSETIKDLEDVAELVSFFQARNGAQIGFRLKYHDEYSSHPTRPFEDPGEMDQLLGVGDGSETEFQLKKTYTSGAGQMVKTILKPVAATVRVWVNSVEKTDGVDFTVDTTTGIVLFTVAPTNGHNVHASFEFDFPVAFSEETSEWLSVTREDVEEGNIPEILLEELFEAQSGFGDYYAGGAYRVASAANLTVAPGLGRAWHVNMTVASRVVTLPNPADIPYGDPIVKVFNAGATHTWTLNDHLGASLGNVAAGAMKNVGLMDDGSGGKAYYSY